MEKKPIGRQPVVRKIKKKNKNGGFDYVWNEPVVNFLKAIKLGMSNQKAADYAGFGESSLYLWLSYAEHDLDNGVESVYIDFLEEIKKARAECQAFHLQNIIKAGQSGNWQASAWVLERIYNKEFGANRTQLDESDKVEVTNDVPNK